MSFRRESAGSPPQSQPGSFRQSASSPPHSRPDPAEAALDRHAALSPDHPPPSPQTRFDAPTKPSPQKQLSGLDRAAADGLKAPDERNSKFRSAVKGIIRARRRRRGKKVQVGYKINGIRNVHSIDCMFTVDFKVFYYWTDDKCKGRKGRLELNEPGLFNPELVIDNDAGLQLTHWEFQVKDSKTGLVKLSEYYRGKLMIPNMSLDMFPFDFQNLRICIKPHKKTIDEVELHPLPDECAIEHHARHEWNVIGSRTAMYATNPEHSTTAKVYSALHVIVLVERESDWHVRMIMCDLRVLRCCGAFTLLM